MRKLRLIRILIVSLLWLTVVRLSAQPPAPPIIEQCAALLASDRPMPDGADAPIIRIVAPRDGEIIYGTEVAITVEIQNFAVELGTGHWHLWLNGQLRGMLYQTSGIVDLRPGSYQLCASLGDPNHMDLGMPDGITFTVQEPSAGTPVATLTVPREAAPVIDEPGGLTPVHLVLILGLGLVAIALGAWLGSRFPKRRSPKR